MKLDYFFSFVHHFTLTTLNSCTILLSNRSVPWGPSATLSPCGLSFLLPWITALSTSFITPLCFLSNCLLFKSLMLAVSSGKWHELCMITTQHIKKERFRRIIAQYFYSFYHLLLFPICPIFSLFAILCREKIHVVQGNCTGSCSLKRTFG